MGDCVFCKIVSGEIPSKKLYEDDLVCAFEDLNPMAPVHVLIIPKVHIENAAHLTDNDDAIVARMFKAARILAKERGVDESGFRLVLNAGTDAGQTVFHMHMHLLGGALLGRFGQRNNP